MAKFPIDTIIVGNKAIELLQTDPDLPGVQVGLNFEVTQHGYLITRDWGQQRDSEDNLSLYAKETRNIIEKYYLDRAGAVIVRVAMSTEWEPVKESRRLQLSNASIKQPDALPKAAPFMTMAVAGDPGSDRGGE